MNINTDKSVKAEFPNLHRAWVLLHFDQGMDCVRPFPKFPNDAVHWADVRVAEDYLASLNTVIFEKFITGQSDGGWCYEQGLPTGPRETADMVLECLFEELNG